jgi:hypothetical protein
MFIQLLLQFLYPFEAFKHHRHAKGHCFLQD